MALPKASYKTEDEIPEQYRELYAERNGEWTLIIPGIKNQGDVDRLNKALESEREETKKAKRKLEAYNEIGTPDEIHAKLDRIPELEAAADGKVDDAKLEEMANKRAEAKIAAATAPLKRDLDKALREKTELQEETTRLSTDLNTRRLHDAVRPVMAELKVVPEHHEDVLMYAERHLVRSEDGNGFYAKADLNGITAGANPRDWLTEMVEKRPGWLPPTQGADARGSRVSGIVGGQNPWSADHWSITKQAQFEREHGRDKAERAASAAGSKLGSLTPPKS